MTRHAVRYVLPLVAAASLQLTGCGDDSPQAGSPSATSSRIGLGDFTDSPSIDESSSPSPASQWRPLESEPDGASLAAGAYGLTANGVSHHVAVVRAPEGYQSLGGWTFVTGAPFHAMGFVTATRVPPDPCVSQGPDKFDAAVNPGPSVKDLARALVAQTGAETSEPVPVTVGGHDGLYLTYQVAKGVDVLACQERVFDIFSTGPGSWWLEASRERAAIWILDVDGDRVVLAWVAVPGVTQAQMREMTRMVRSARFVAS
jgi:hypothetical protein